VNWVRIVEGDELLESQQDRISFGNFGAVDFRDLTYIQCRMKSSVADPIRALKREHGISPRSDWI